MRTVCLTMKTFAIALLCALLAGCATPQPPQTPRTPSVAPSAVSALPSSSELPGTVPAGAMSLSIQNGTTLKVTLLVNSVLVATLAPGACIGCQLDDGVPASRLSPLPWQVEARSPSGRILVSMTVRQGDVIKTADGWQGDANRVDLSCGRLDIWSGPPLAGPAPGPGSPDDCAP
jgi:hypothetical protein